MATMHQAHTTTDHDVIRRWAEERGGRPAIVESTWDGETAVLHIDFNEPDESLMDISWSEFFRIFDESDLAFLYQDEVGNGEETRFFKLVSRDGSDDEAA